MAAGKGAGERRARQRFPLNLELRFSAGKGGKQQIQGTGQVVNLSSQGVAFRTATQLELDCCVNASLQWPVALNGDCALRVSMTGRVVRVESGLTVMSVDTYEFRTNGRIAPAAGQEVEVLKQRIGGLFIQRPILPVTA